MKDLERIESTKLSLESPQFKCFYAAHQYREHQCLQMSFYKTFERGVVNPQKYKEALVRINEQKQKELARMGGSSSSSAGASGNSAEMKADLSEDEIITTNDAMHGMLKEQYDREERNNKEGLTSEDRHLNVMLGCGDDSAREEDIVEVNFTNEAPVSAWLVECWETISAARRSMTSNLGNWLKRLFMSEEMITAIEKMKQDPKEREMMEKERKRRERQRAACDEERHLGHCLNLDRILTRCAADVYARMPRESPAMRPLPPPFHTLTIDHTEDYERRGDEYIRRYMRPNSMTDVVSMT